MPDTDKIPLEHYDDGLPSSLRRATVYTKLGFYQKSDILVQLTKTFCERFLPKYGDRTVDQMVQAARSIKQNIAEGLTDGQTSFEVEIRLLGIARGSNAELLEDYQDYIKHHDIKEWAQDNVKRFDKLHAFCKEHSDESDYHPYYKVWTDEEMCNTAICLCHMVDKALESFIAKRDREFVEEGGVRERMTAARLDHRGTQKQIIAQQEEEIARLRAQVASLQREVAMLRGGEAGEAGGSGGSGLSGGSGSSGGSGDSGGSGGSGSSGGSGGSGGSGDSGDSGGSGCSGASR